MAEEKNNPTNELGFGSKTANQKARLLNQDGSFNVRKKGLSRMETFNLFHHLIHLSLFKFVASIIGVFIAINALFTGIYLLIGTDHLMGLVYKNGIDQLYETFFFSTQTFTTVGYGRVNPVGLLTNVISATEALTGLMSFAVITGLIYGRFSKPKSNILYSKNAVIAPFAKTGKALMFRLANKLDTNLLDVEVRLIIAYLDKNSGNRIFGFLPLEIDKISFLPSAWTLVHGIDDKSTIYGWTADDFIKNELELLIVFKAFDETFSQNVNNRFSYKANEIVSNAKFKQILFTDEMGNSYVELDRISEYELL
jgi:inward rectifier potassium channel